MNNNREKVIVQTSIIGILAKVLKQESDFFPTPFPLLWMQ